MNARRIAWSIVGLLSVSVPVRGAEPVATVEPGESGGFVRGHIFVAMEESEACDFGGREWIIEIDPDTGAWSVFADSDDGICVVSGLRFTPDGSRLLAANAGRSRIQAFHPDGTSEIILDTSDGLNRPYGSNCLSFDDGGDLYVVSAENSRILRYPRSGGAATVFADHSDGIAGRGALEFSPSGDLFYAGGGTIRQITTEGESSLFDTIGSKSMVSDDLGTIFVTSGGNVVSYSAGDPTSRHVLVSGFKYADAITMSGDGTVLYVVETLGILHAIDPDTGASSLIADFSELSSIYTFPTGATVYAPDPDLIPGRCCFGLHTPSPGCMDGLTRPECGDHEAAPFLFTVKESCPPEGPDCETISGACCDIDPFGGCSDDTLIAECQCPTCRWNEGQTCAQVECVVNSIPTASTWGLAVLTLLLMIGAKIVFARRRDGTVERRADNVCHCSVSSAFVLLLRAWEFESRAVAKVPIF